MRIDMDARGIVIMVVVVGIAMWMDEQLVEPVEIVTEQEKEGTSVAIRGTETVEMVVASSE